MSNKLTTFKVDKEIHKQVKIYCATSGKNLLDYYNDAARYCLPAKYKIALEKKKA